MQLKTAEILKLHGAACQTCVPMVDIASQTNETKEDHTEELQQLQREYQRLIYEANQKSEVSFSAVACPEVQWADYYLFMSLLPSSQKKNK